MKQYLFTLVLFIIALAFCHSSFKNSLSYTDAQHDIATSYLWDHEKDLNSIKDSINSNNIEFNKRITSLEKNIYWDETKKAIDIIKETGLFEAPIIVSSVSVQWDIVNLTLHFWTCDWCVSDVSVNINNKTVVYE